MFKFASRKLTNAAGPDALAKLDSKKQNKPNPWRTQQLQQQHAHGCNIQSSRIPSPTWQARWRQHNLFG